MAARKQWVFSPHAGGSKIPPALQAQVHSRILDYARRHYDGSYTRIEVRFRGALCYIDAFSEPSPPSPALLRALKETRAHHLERLRATPMHLCRLRYFSFRSHWSVALYTYSNERYAPTVLPTGEYFGTPEECFALAASFHLVQGTA